MKLNINFDGRIPVKINGDIKYQIDLISVLKKKIILNFGYNGYLYKLSSIIRNTSSIIIKIPFIKKFFSEKLNILIRQKRYNFKNNSEILFSHYHFPFSFKKKNQKIIWSTQGIMCKNYYKNYKNVFSINDDIYLYKKIDNLNNSIFCIWDKKFAKRTKKLCNLKSPIKIIAPTLGNAEPKNLKKKINVKKKIQLLFIGKDARIKGLYSLLYAIKKLNKEKNNFHLKVVTQNYLNLKIKNVSIFNNINDNKKKKLLEQCDIFILPTVAETFGYSLMEAIAYKCAILTSNYYPLNNLCINNFNGFLIKNKDSKDLYSKLKKLLNNKKKIALFKKNSLKVYNQNYSKKNFFKKFNKMLIEIEKKDIKSDI